MTSWPKRYVDPLRDLMPRRGSTAAEPHHDVHWHSPIDLHAAIEPTPDDEMRRSPRDGLNQLCDLSDWRWGRTVDVMAELSEKHIVYRKAWEDAKCLTGLEQLGVLTPSAVGLSVGAGAEKPLFWLANRVAAVHATDLYEDQSGYPWGSDFLKDPSAFAPFDYRTDHLVAHVMSGTALEFAADTFDFVYTLSSIEHFGGHDAASVAMQEMCRVVKPGGVVCVVTELLLSSQPNAEMFTYEELRQYIVEGSPLRLVEPEIDTRISASLLLYPYDVLRETHLAHSPHIVMTSGGTHYWTSIILFFRKPAPTDIPNP